MRKLINISAFLFFLWLLLDALNVPAIFLNFLLVGELPGMQKSLSPSLMLAIITTVTGIIVFELLARKVEIIRKTRQQLLSLLVRRERLPLRRFNRINPAN